MTLWLLFACKFVDRVLECVGHQRISKDEGMQQILSSLQALEESLPSAEIGESTL